MSVLTCPGCTASGDIPVKIYATVELFVLADKVEKPLGEPKYDRDSRCVCMSCGKDGRLLDFQPSGPRAKPWVSSIGWASWT